MLEKKQKNVKVLLSPEYLRDVAYYHKVTPTAKEWSGILVYKIISGSLETNDLVLEAIGIHYCDYKDSGSTEYQPARHIKELDERFNYIENEYRLGLVHTHHNMSVFFSGTDAQDLQDALEASNGEFVISIVNNYKGEYYSEIGYTELVVVEKPTMISVPYYYTTNTGEQREGKYEKIEKVDIVEETRAFSSTVVVEYSVPDNIKNNVDAVKKAREEKNKVMYPQYKSHTVNYGSTKKVSEEKKVINNLGVFLKNHCVEDTQAWKNLDAKIKVPHLNVPYQLFLAIKDHIKPCEFSDNKLGLDNAKIFLAEKDQYIDLLESVEKLLPTLHDVSKLNNLISIVKDMESLIPDSMKKKLKNHSTQRVMFDYDEQDNYYMSNNRSKKKEFEKTLIQKLAYAFTADRDEQKVMEKSIDLYDAIQGLQSINITTFNNQYWNSVKDWFSYNKTEVETHLKQVIDLAVTCLDINTEFNCDKILKVINEQR